MRGQTGRDGTGPDTIGPDTIGPDTIGPDCTQQMTRRVTEQMSVVETRIEQLREGLVGSDVTDTYGLDLENVHEELRVADEQLRARQEELGRLLELERSDRSQHERLVAALPAAVLVTDGAAAIRAANPAAGKLLAARPGALLGKPLQAMVSSQERGELRRLLNEVNGGEDGFRTVVTLHAPKAAPVRVEVHAQASEDLQACGRVLTWLLLPVPGNATTEPASGRPGLAAAFAELTRVSLQTSDKRELLTKVASICARAFGPGVAVSVHAGPPAGPDHVGSDSRLAQDLDGAQMISAEGPCHTAWQTGEPAVSADLLADSRWPRLARGIEAGRVGGVIALPLLRGSQPIGNLNVYAVPGRRLGDEQVAVAELMAQIIAAILHEIDQRTELAKLAGQMQEALQSRAVIDQAKGMIMLQDRCDADTAFKKLVRMSSRSNVKLRVVAQQIVDSAAHR